ncbi:MAG: hypothetical protein RL709_670 [Pseudomonadota bacterium]|jgi:hypothetical protein
MSNNSNQAGKGDKPRPVIKKTYNESFDKIKWTGVTKAKEVTTKKGKTTYKY